MSSEQEKNNELFDACQKGDLQKVQQLHAEGANIIAMDSKGYTPLHIAVLYNKGTVVDMLMQWGARGDEVDRSGGTPFYTAIACDHTDIVQRFLDQKININVHGETTTPPLHYAARYGSGKVVKMLIQHYRAQVNEVFEACKAGDLQKVQQLRAEGAYITARDSEGNTPLHIAALYNQEAVVDMLIECGARGDKMNTLGYTPFDFAISRGYTEIVTKFLAQVNEHDEAMVDEYTDATVNEYDILGYTPLHYAAMYGNIDTAQTLLQLGAYNKALDKNGHTIYSGHTPHYYALKYQYPFLAQLLSPKIYTLAQKEAARALEEATRKIGIDLVIADAALEKAKAAAVCAQEKVEAATRALEEARSKVEEEGVDLVNAAACALEEALGAAVCAQEKVEAAVRTKVEVEAVVLRAKAEATASTQVEATLQAEADATASTPEAIAPVSTQVEATPHAEADATASAPNEASTSISQEGDDTLFEEALTSFTTTSQTDDNVVSSLGNIVTEQ